MNFKLFAMFALTSIIPWGSVLSPFGKTVQIIGVSVQVLGLILAIIFRKKIWLHL